MMDHDEREEEDHGDVDVDEDAEGEMEHMEVNDGEEAGYDDEDGEEDNAAQASLKASLLDLASQLKAATASVENRAISTTNAA